MFEKEKNIVVNDNNTEIIKAEVRIPDIEEMRNA